MLKIGKTVMHKDGVMAHGIGKVVARNDNTKRVLVLWTGLNGMKWVEANKEFELVC